MTNKELRRLRKTELMELLVDQMKQNKWQQKKLEGQETDLKASASRLEEERQQIFERAEQAAEQARFYTKHESLREVLKMIGNVSE